MIPQGLDGSLRLAAAPSSFENAFFDRIARARSLSIITPSLGRGENLLDIVEEHIVFMALRRGRGGHAR